MWHRWESNVMQGDASLGLHVRARHCLRLACCTRDCVHVC